MPFIRAVILTHTILILFGSTCSPAGTTQPHLSVKSAVTQTDRQLPPYVPDPPLNTFTVLHKWYSTPCLRVQMRANFMIRYEQFEGRQAIASVPIGLAFTQSGICGQDKQSLFISGFLSPGWQAEMNFSRSGSEYTLSSVALNYNLNDADFFPNAAKTGVNFREHASHPNMMIALGNHFTCSAMNISLSSVTLLTRSITLQAFRVDSDSSLFVGRQEKCLRDTVPGLILWWLILLCALLVSFGFGFVACTLLLYRWHRYHRHAYSRI